jgi:hypothetical protein
MNKKPLITDEQSLDGAMSRFGNAIQTYDDGFGTLFIHRGSMGITGIVRAQTWEDAYSICEDEFFPEASETIAELIEEYGEAFTENDCFQEGYGFRNNGPNERDTLKHGIYSKDLNGDALDTLTPELVELLEITLNISDAFEVVVGNIGTVYSGTNLSEATTHFDEFVEQSKLGNCRASGEDVTLMKNGEPMREYSGTQTSE